MTDVDDGLATPDSFFPATFVDAIVETLQDLLPSCLVVDRPLEQQDPSNSIGVFADSWSVDEQSHQIGQFEPQDNRYVLRVQSIVKAMSQAEGRALHANLAKSIRVILYRDTTLRVRFGSATEELLSSVERVKGYGVTRQEFLSGKVGPAFMFMTNTYIYVDTYTTFLNV